MNDASTTATLFREQGVLPFTGRREQLQHLHSIAASLDAAPGLRITLITGESGIGKSELLRQFQGTLSADAVVLQMAFHAGTPDNPIAHIIPALAASPIAHKLLRKVEPAGTLPNVSAILQRVTRLRPTFLLFDDVHLLSDEAVGQLGMLLQSLRDEPIAVFFLAQPGASHIRPILERFPPETIDLPSLTHQETAELWHRLFNSATDTDIITLLLESTSGNPLALRSALRAMLQAEALKFNGIAGQWQLSATLPELKRILASSVRFITGELAMQLSRDHLEAAERLAVLGELFDRQAARTMLGKDAHLLEKLLAEQIVLPAGAPAPAICGNSSEPPLHFTQTLLQRSLLGAQHFTPDRFIQVLAEGYAVYSIQPFELLAEQAGAPALPPGTARRALEQMASSYSHMLLYGLNRTPIKTLWKATDRLFDCYTPQWSPTEQKNIRLSILRNRLVMRGWLRPEERQACADEYLALTEQPANLEEALHRFDALKLRFGLTEEQPPETDTKTSDEWMALIEQFPEAALSTRYFFTLLDAVVDTMTVNSRRTPLLKKLVEDLRNIRSGITTTEPPATLGGPALPFLMHHFGTYENGARHLTLEHILSPDVPDREVQRRTLVMMAGALEYREFSEQSLETHLQLLERLTELAPDDIQVMMYPAAFLTLLGRFEEALALSEARIPVLLRFGGEGIARAWTLIGKALQTAFGADMRKLSDEIARFLDTIPTSVWAPMFRLFVMISLLTGEEEWMVEYISGIDPARKRTALVYGPTLALMRLHGHASATEGPPGQEFRLLDPLLRVLHNSDSIDADIIADHAVHVLNIRAVMTKHTLTLLLAVRLIEAHAETARRPELLERLQPDVRKAIETALEWMASHSLVSYMNVVLVRYGHYLTGKALEHWQSRIEKITMERAASKQAESTGRIHISLFGTITIQHSGTVPQPVRGGRHRILLGLMAANTAGHRPLSYEDFCRIASGVEDDVPYAKHLSGNAVSRLRSIIGHEAVRTDTLPPYLNTDIVDVDFLNVERLREQALGMLNEQQWFKAYEAMLEAFAIADGSTPFPTLYAEFFETARDDYESRMRNALLKVVSALLAERDFEHAEILLRHGFNAMPEDEEVASLLKQVLVQQHRSAEASHIRSGIAP